MSNNIAYAGAMPQPGAAEGSKWVARVLAGGMMLALLFAFVLDKYNPDPTNRTTVIGLGFVAITLGSLLVLSNVRAGICVFILVGCISPRIGSNLRLEDFLMPALLLAWLMRGIKGRKFLVRTPITTAVLLVCVTMLVSFSWGIAQDTIPVPIEGALIAIKRVEYALLFFFGLNSVRNREESRTLLLTFLGGALLASIIALGTAGADSSVGDTRATGLDAENYNTFAGFLVIAASLAATGALQYRGRVRLAFAVATMILVLTLLKTYSREGYFILAVSLLALGILRYRVLIPIMLVLTVLAQFVIPATVIERVSDSVSQVQNYQTETAGLNSFTARVSGWEGRWNMVEKQPVLGSGPGSVPMHIDNEYLLRLIEGGIIGLAAFLYLLACFGKYLVLCVRKLRGTESEPFAYGLLAAFIAMLVQGMVAAAWSTIRTMEPFWILTGALGGLIVHKYYITSAEDAQSAQVEGVPEKHNLLDRPVSANQEPS